jgi:phosphatidylserine/phosphatidylglycerophosphate/cardiolipin synthase-like enzyme
MSTKERLPTDYTGKVQSPFLDEEPFVGETEERLKPHVALLAMESPFLQFNPGDFETEIIDKDDRALGADTFNISTRWEPYEHDIPPTPSTDITKALDNKDWTLALKLAIQERWRDENDMTNLIFFARHPELPKASLDPKGPNFKRLSAEWTKILNNEVWKAIEASAKNIDLVVSGKEVTDHHRRFFVGKRGKRLKKLVEDAAREVDLNPGLLGTIMMAETRSPQSYLSSEKASSYHIGADDFYEGRAAIEARVPAYAKVKWDNSQTPVEHFNDAKQPRLVKTILFDSGPDGALATAVYVKFREVRLREIAADSGEDFDSLPLATRLALTRMAMAAGTAGATPYLKDALKGKDIFVRQAIPVREYQTKRNATVRTAQAMHLSDWVFGIPVPAAAASQPEVEESEGWNEEQSGYYDVYSDHEEESSGDSESPGFEDSYIAGDRDHYEGNFDIERLSISEFQFGPVGEELEALRVREEPDMGQDEQPVIIQQADPKAEDFMLSSQNDGDDVKFRPPGRQGNKIEPLIDGERFFPAIEEAIADAEESVYCTFWSIYPDTPLLSTKVRTALKVKDWQELLITVAKKNDVKIRIILSDFDPRNDNNHHQKRSWNAFNKFVKAATKAGLTKDQFQVFVSLHPAVISDIIAKRVTKQRLVKTIAKFNADGLKGLENSPGIWGDVKLTGKKLSLVARPVLDAFPASHHQKSVVVDHRIGFLGGANISDYFHDTSQHLNKEPAHDIYCRMEGPVVADLERNFVGRWNAESAAFNNFITTANANGKALGKFKIDHPFPISTLTLSKATLGKQGNAVAQILRTLSSSIQSSLVGSYKVQVVRDDIAQAYEKAISLATRFIYIENQVMRQDDLANRIIARFGKMPKLQVIIVLPVVPEEIADGTADEITLHGQALQHDALKKLRGALGKNLGLYSLLQKKMSTGKMTFFNSVLIDVHCKILVVDDLYASIGSANTSPRSFSLDSEINVGWYEPDTVKKFREDLWKEHLGSPTGSLFADWKPADYVQEWDAVAAKNEKAKPSLRQGFIVTHDPDKKKGRKTPLLPDFLSEVGHPDQADILGEH